MSQTIDTIIDKKAYEQVEMLRDDVQGLYMDLLKIMEMGKSGFKMDTSSIKLPADLKEFMAQHTQYAQKQEKQIESLEKKVLKLKEARSSYTKNLSWEEKAERKLQLAKDRVKESESELGKAIVRTRNEANANNRVSKQTATLYGRVSAKLKETSNEYYELALKKRLTGKATDEEIRRMSLLESRMDKYSDSLMTVEKRSGNYHRQVGNYKSGFDGLAMSMAQLTREGPAFAYSMQTGFLAISNNLPILVDEINRVKVANKALAAEGKTTRSVLSQVGAAILSWQTALSLGITLLTIYGKDVIDWATSLGKATDITEEFNKALAETRSSMQLEIVKLQTLIDIAGDETLEREKRNDAVKWLQKEYPDLLKNLTTENTKSNEIADSINRITTALENKAKIQAAEQLITKEAQKLFEDQIKIEEDFAARLEKAREIEENGVNPNNYYDKNLPKEEANLVETLMKQKKAALLGSEEDYKAYVKNLNEILREVPNLFEALGGDEGGGSGNGPDPKDYSAEDFYNLQKARLERAIEVNKEITENEQEELSKRLAANNALTEKKQELAVLERDWVIANAKDRTDKITETEEAYTSQSEENTKQHVETEKEILSSNFEYQVDQFKKTAEAKELALQQEINAATKKMIEEGATREQIEARIQQIRKDSYKQQLEDLIAQAEKELLVVANNAEEKAEVEKWLANLRKELNDLNMPEKSGDDDKTGNTLFSDEEIEGLQKVQELIVSISDLFAAFSARRIAQIEAEIEANNRLYEKVQNDEHATEQQKEESRKFREQREEELRKKLAKEKEKQAKIDKAAAVAEIAINTAIAISKTLGETGIFGLPLVPIVAALGAIQIATVLAQPIPKFKEGHLSGTYEGWAMINDSPSANYREVLEQADGTLYSPEERNQKVYMKRGDKVHKSHDSFLENKGYKEIMDATIMASLVSGNPMTTEKEVDEAFNRRLLETIDKGIKKGFSGAEKPANTQQKDFDYNRFLNEMKKHNFFNV